MRIEKVNKGDKVEEGDWDNAHISLKGEPLKAVLELRHLKEQKIKKAVSLVDVVNEAIVNELKRVKGGG